jgi:hypothetical protein
VIQDGTMEKEIIFNGTMMACMMMGKKVKEIDCKSVQKVHVATSKIFGTLVATIYYENNGKSSVFPGIGGVGALPTDPGFHDFKAHLKTLTSHVPWTEGQAGKVDSRGGIVLDLVFDRVPYGALSYTLPRSVVVFIDFILLSCLVVTLPLGLYQLIKGWRMRVSEDGLAIVKMFPRNISFSDLKAVHSQPVEVTTLQLGQEIGKHQILAVYFEFKDGKKPYKVIMQYDAAKVLFDKLAKIGLAESLNLRKKAA